MIPFVDLRMQYSTIKEEIDGAIQGVIADSAFIGGTYVSRFEQEFAAYLGMKHCLGCANGTDAIEIALRSLGIGKGDEVLVPANSFIASSEAVGNVGAQVVFVDSHPEYYTIDVDRIEESISERTKAIIAVHLYGLPAEMDAILAIARRKNLFVIEDVAQAHGALFKGKKTGTLGDVACFSYYPGKNLGAYGDAGALATNNTELDARARMLANHGRISKYDHDHEGRNSRLDGLQAAILSVKLRHLEKWTDLRRAHAQQYHTTLANQDLVLPVSPEYSRHVYHLFVIRVRHRDRVQRYLKEHGVESGIHYPIALPLLKAYSRLGHSAEAFPVASSQMGTLLSLPMFAELEKGQIERVADVLKHALKES